MIKLTKFRVSDQRCPRCGTLATAAAGMDGVAPKSGDVTVCIECRATLAFAEDMSLRYATAEEIAEVTEDLSLIQNGLKAIRRK